MYTHMHICMCVCVCVDAVSVCYMQTHMYNILTFQCRMSLSVLGRLFTQKILYTTLSSREAGTRSFYVDQCSYKIGMLSNFVDIIVYYTSLCSNNMSFTYFETLHPSQMCSNAC